MCIIANFYILATLIYNARSKPALNYDMQIYAIPLFDMTETYLVKEKKFKPSTWLRLVVRFIFVGKHIKYRFHFKIVLSTSISVWSFNKVLCPVLFVAALTMVIGMAIPFFGGLLGFFGGLALAPTTYFVSA